MAERLDLAGWLERIGQLHPAGIALGLDRVRGVATRMGLGRPAAEVVLVAGTNGKGSTVAFMEAIARADGRRVGSYTSPHLLAYNERVRIDGEPVDDAALVEAFEAVEAARAPRGGGAVALTYFEMGTLAALWLFGRAGLDLALLEVGLGGRLDATNIVEPDVAVITTVDIDHADWLGPDRESIGREKAGIARAWKPLVLGDDDPPSSVLERAYAIGASALRVGCDFFFEPSPADAEPGLWRWREVGCRFDLPRPALAAPVQLRNAAVAIAALRALEQPPAERAIREGLVAARLVGRLQRFQRDGIEVLVDVGHNPQAAAALAQWLVDHPATGATRAVYAALADKDAAGVVAELAGRIAHWHLAGLEGEGARSCDGAGLRSRLAGTDAASGSVHADVAGALEAALAASIPGDRVLVFGSFHTAAAALRLLQAAPG
ncbi:bifunctional tetrahydrofolate synthase/dihydrofolate synthase [Lysobacter sp. GX 14042]|uniref:bifunctional tetrahydrofolate synthase/dihydrofolate synthase n=1 Tax=Lysobacter sp. GX 14042 TaxID=2907155 RepID=UPI001F39C7C2|nr:bifunctional tetrahydrofolate synthase/dihydrofolate synthase [Lysobacter sp. GX 14042]MCE7033264.1 bifunctional tetrahydrofolate synthase/dihydrofolate synthase [Lysobacter sp. GX 14042]